MIEYQTLVQMSDQVARMVQDTSATKAVKIKEWINTKYAEAARNYRWPQLIRPSEGLNTYSAASPFLYLPKDAEDVLFIIPTNNIGALSQQDIQQLIDKAGGSFATAGYTTAWAPAGESGKLRDFHTVAEQLTIQHTSASSTITAVVQGTSAAAPGNPSSSEIVEAVSVLPTTGGTTVATFNDLTSFSVSDLPAGVSAYIAGVTSGYVYANIVSGETTARYKRVRLMQPSSTSERFTVYYKKRVSKLSLDNQSVEIPVAQYLIKAATAEMLMNQREYGAAQIRMVEAMGMLEKAVAASAGSEGIVQAVPAGRHRMPAAIIRTA